MRKLLTLLCALATVTGMYAAKAISTPLSRIGTDGQPMTVYLHGDEHLHWYTNSDGALLSVDGGRFRLATKAEQARHARSLSLLEAETRAESVATGSPAYFPHAGSPKALVILAEFQDVKFTVNNPKETFTRLFNDDAEENDTLFGKAGNYKNYGSVRGYFEDSSYGQFTPQFTVTDVVTLSHDISYYGGSSSGGTSDKSSDALSEAVKLADAQVDYSEFCYNGTSGPIMVILIFAGYSENQGGDYTTMWAKCSSTYISTNETACNVRWVVSSELAGAPSDWTNMNTYPHLTGIGVICHELSHAMGLPDMYPTSSSAYANNQEMERWDLMDAGEYVGNIGYRPAPYTSWEREVMGWTTIEALEVTADPRRTLAPMNSDNAKSLKIVNPSDENEYMVLENIRKSGWYGAMPNEGMLVYHVAYSSRNVNMTDSPNNTKGKPRMAVVPADGIVYASHSYVAEEDNDKYYYTSHKGDVFPGADSVTTLNNTMNLPNFAWYTGTATVLPALNGIKIEDTDDISFNYYADYATAINRVGMGTSSAVSPIYTLGGTRIQGSVDSLPKGIYIIGGEKVVVR